MTLSCLQCTRCQQNAQHLTVIQAFVLDGLVLLIEVKIVQKVLICVIIKLFLWLLQIVAETVRNLFMAFISKLVGNILHGRCGVIQDVCYGSHM